MTTNSRHHFTSFYYPERITSHNRDEVIEKWKAKLDQELGGTATEEKHAFDFTIVVDSTSHGYLLAIGETPVLQEASPDRETGPHYVPIEPANEDRHDSGGSRTGSRRPSDAADDDAPPPADASPYTADIRSKLGWITGKGGGQKLSAPAGLTASEEQAYLTELKEAIRGLYEGPNRPAHLPATLVLVTKTQGQKFIVKLGKIQN
jgi:hypothetical protein